jgi:DNA-binding SARP family transcriptional activator/tetratricopeptide (TPR) repeat protein
MSIEVGFRLLGPVEVWAGGRRLEVGAARPQCVLAVLLLDANRCVSVDEIVDRVWGAQRLPDEPRSAVLTHVSRLRSALAEIDGVAVVRQSGGYLISLDERLVDVHRFHALVKQARGAATDDHADALMEEALGLWRGEPLAGLDTPWINAARQNLLLHRHAARLDLTDIRLRRGRHAAMLGELAAQAAEHPLDERVCEQLMLALYRSGRQGDALARYRQLRQQLADELGADPGPALRQLHQQILDAAPALAAPVSSPAPVAARSVAVPRQLPAAPRWFTGRTRELARLSAALNGQPRSGHNTLVVSAIGGSGGIGKTWLALHWAHQNLDRFPDGQLYVNLRGFDPSGQPMPAATAVRGFLGALGVAPAAVPPDPDAQAGLYRSLTAGRRMLILADNARDAAQVIPLLPGSPTCTVLVTSRQRLPGLVTAHGALTVELDVLSEDEGRDLLARYLGRARVVAERDAVTAVLESCAGLPLAVSIVAAHALALHDLPLAVLAEDLRDASARLDALETSDLTANVRAALSWSYDALGPEERRVFGLLALAPGPDIDAAAAASLTALPGEHLRMVLRDLTDAHLLQHHAPDRYRLHDLVRLYGTERANADQPARERTAALRRLVGFYLHTAHAGQRLLSPRQHSPLRLRAPGAGVMPRPLPDPSAALTWFDQEHACLLTIQQLACSHGWDVQACLLAWALDAYHHLRGHVHDRSASWRLALAAAERLDNRAVQILAHQTIGRGCALVADNDDALDHLRRALTMAEQDGDTFMQARAYYLMGYSWVQRGDAHQALDHAGQALRLFRIAGNPIWEANTLNGMGWIQMRLDRYAEARVNCEAALALYSQHLPGQGSDAPTLDSLGVIAHHFHDYDRALAYYRRAVAICRDEGDVYNESDILDHLAQTHVALGCTDQARDTWQRALELYQTQHRLTDAQRVAQCLAALT